MPPVHKNRKSHHELWKHADNISTVKGLKEAISQLTPEPVEHLEKAARKSGAAIAYILDKTLAPH